MIALMDRGPGGAGDRSQVQGAAGDRRQVQGAGDLCSKGVQEAQLKSV